jgi:hypothetical protein
MTLLRTCGLLLLAAVLVAIIVSVRDAQRKERLRDIAAAHRELRATRLAPPGSAPRAGISARANVEVAAFPDRLAQRLHGDPDFHRLSHRCGVCHATPDPDIHPGADWPEVIQRMSRLIDEAGLLPLSPADSAAVLRVLTAHATR